MRHWGLTLTVLVFAGAAFGQECGITFRTMPHMLLRAEFRDYLTTFQKAQIVPAPNNTARGIFEQFTPLFEISYTF